MRRFMIIKQISYKDSISKLSISWDHGIKLRMSYQEQFLRGIIVIIRIYILKKYYI